MGATPALRGLIVSVGCWGKGRIRFIGKVKRGCDSIVNGARSCWLYDGFCKGGVSPTTPVKSTYAVKAGDAVGDQVKWLSINGMDCSVGPQDCPMCRL